MKIADDMRKDLGDNLTRVKGTDAANRKLK